MKRYLCVGVNAYAGQQLEGCVNDAYDWEAELVDRQFVGTVLTDGDATRANITGVLRDTLNVSRRGDTVVFQFSGHGTWVPDGDGDEADGRDEALVPVDYKSGGLITDDGLYRLVRDNRAPGVKVLIIADSCFSGTVSRFLATNDTPARMPFSVQRPGGYRPRFMPPSRALPPEAIPAAERVVYAPKNATSRTGAALMSGCRDDQVSYDAWFLNRANGAFTYAALRALQRANPHTLSEWNHEIHEQITYDQDPQIGGTWWQRNMSRFV